MQTAGHIELNIFVYSLIKHKTFEHLFRTTIDRKMAQNPIESSFIHKIAKFQSRLTLTFLS